MRHEVLRSSPQHIKPFLQGKKNNKNDARAIMIASQQHRMPTVPIKTVSQQEIQMLHDRTVLINRIRDYLRESGIFLAISIY